MLISKLCLKITDDNATYGLSLTKDCISCVTINNSYLLNSETER